MASDHLMERTAGHDGRSTVRLLPTGNRFVNGLAVTYDDEYPPELDGVMSELEFGEAIQRLNGVLQDYWPCNLCFYFGYLCCPCTLGLSFLGPRLCVSDAERMLQGELKRLNTRDSFRRRDIEWTLHKSCCRSWIEIKYFPE